MALTYVIDRERRLVRSRGSGVLTRQIVAEFYSRLLTDPAFDPEYQHLGDLREVTSIALESMGLAEAAAIPVFVPGSKRALVATSDAVYGMARAFASYNERVGQVVRVFRHMDIAEAWLGDAGLEAGLEPA